MMADIQWMDGLRIFPPNENAPDFVKGDIVINPEQAIAWLKKQNGTVRLELKTKKSDGSLYAHVKQKPQRQGSADDYRAMKEGYNVSRQQQQGRNYETRKQSAETPLPQASFPPNYSNQQIDDDFEDDIPF
jgi:hypothetical protein|tara:strand:+ start:55 stop:447 length:393 start_codon:yes stop_codon:yes gene_type:complete